MLIWIHTSLTNLTGKIDFSYRIFEKDEGIALIFFIPKYARGPASGQSIRNELPVAGPVDFYILLKILKHNRSLIPAFLYINDSLILASSEHQCYIF